MCGHTHVHTHRCSKNSAVNSIFKHSVLFHGKTTPLHPPPTTKPEDKSSSFVRRFSRHFWNVSPSLWGQAQARG